MTPRFIVRLEDGTDLLLEDVEALAREVERGRVRETHLLFDASTGRWETAGSAPLFHFLREEEERRARREVSSREEEDSSGEDAGSEAGSAEEPEVTFDLGSLDPPGEGLVEDPFAMDLSLAPAPEEPPLQDPAEPGGAEEPASAPEPPAREGPEPAAEPEPAESSVEPEAGQSPPEGEAAKRAESEDPSPRPASRAPPPARAPGHLAGSRAPIPGGSTPAQRPSPRTPATRARVPLPGGRAAAVGALLLAGVGVLLTVGPPRGSSAEGTIGAGARERGPGAEEGAVPALPDPLLDLAWTLRSEVRQSLFEDLDAMREELGLVNGPPRAWLTGRYFAEASAFPEVRRYWERYAELVALVRTNGAALFVEELDRKAAESLAAAGADAGRIREYLLTEFEQRAPRREERYDALEAVAVAALELHDLLAGREADISYVPALGPALSPEPVLEARIDDPSLEREVKSLLDRILPVLTRSSGEEPVTREHVLTALFEDLVPR